MLIFERDLEIKKQVISSNEYMSKYGQRHLENFDLLVELIPWRIKVEGYQKACVGEAEQVDKKIHDELNTYGVACEQFRTEYNKCLEFKREFLPFVSEVNEVYARIINLYHPDRVIRETDKEMMQEMWEKVQMCFFRNQLEELLEYEQEIMDLELPELMDHVVEKDMERVKGEIFKLKRINKRSESKTPVEIERRLEYERTSLIRSIEYFKKEYEKIMEL